MHRTGFKKPKRLWLARIDRSAESKIRCRFLLLIGLGAQDVSTKIYIFSRRRRKRRADQMNQAKPKKLRERTRRLKCIKLISLRASERKVSERRDHCRDQTPDRRQWASQREREESEIPFESKMHRSWLRQVAAWRTDFQSDRQEEADHGDRQKNMNKKSLGGSWTKSLE